MGMVVSRFEVYLVNLEPTKGCEIRKTRPCLIISPDEMNHALETVIIAPMTTRCREWPTRINLIFETKSGQIVLDQIRAIDKFRLVKKLGKIDEFNSRKVLHCLQEIFS
ncbi:MAG: type II toxin-antitoxin system PemK/MazF family toxin [Candidatus Riflebacteria bacterium]